MCTLVAYTYKSTFGLSHSKRQPHSYSLRNSVGVVVTSLLQRNIDVVVTSSSHRAVGVTVRHSFRRVVGEILKWLNRQLASSWKLYKNLIYNEICDQFLFLIWNMKKLIWNTLFDQSSKKRRSHFLLRKITSRSKLLSQNEHKSWWFAMIEILLSISLSNN